jgi:tRNA pseudouridine38-40 synthase
MDRIRQMGNPVPAKQRKARSSVASGVQSKRARATLSTGRSVRLKLTIAYDGTRYAGWQVQKIGVGIQQKVEEALARLFPSSPRLHSSSRTDSGVHALGMVAHVEIPRDELKMAARKVPLALNAHLPDDIRVLSAARTPADFHARFDASAKQYRYFVWNHLAPNPLLRHTAWHVPRPLDVEAMRTAAGFFLGRHDFRSFAATRGYSHSSTVRTLARCTVNRSGSLFTFVIEGDGFLYKMCRSIVGTLVQVGLGRFQPQAVLEMLAHQDRRVAGMTAPAHGLVLWKVIYRRKQNRQHQGHRSAAHSRPRVSRFHPLTVPAPHARRSG